MKKLSILVAGAAGYVLGSRAGRERYEQIKNQAQKTWRRPAVQNVVDDVEQTVRAKASDVGSKVVNKVTGGSDPTEGILVGPPSESHYR